MWGYFRSLTPDKQIAILAVVATLVAAAVSTTTSLVTAGVNAWASNRNARKSRRRDFRISLFQPFITYLADENWRLSKALEDNADLPSKPMAEAYRTLELQFLNRNHAANIRTVYGHVYADSDLGNEIEMYSRAIDRMQTHVKHIYALLQPHFREQESEWMAIPGVPEEWSAFLGTVPEAVNAGHRLRDAFEEYIFT